MELRALGNVVSKRPVATIIVILLITSIFGFYTAQMQMSADLSTFLPNDEMVKAQMKVSENFGDTDIVQVIVVSNNTLSKSSLMDMLTIEENLQNDSIISKNLRTPNSPSESIISPADIIIMGNITLNFENKLTKLLKNMSAEMKGLNFTVALVPIRMMSSVMSDYRDIYENATDIRDDAKNIVLLMFSKPSSNETGMGKIEPLLQNLTYVLTQSNNFSVKSKVLTMLTPPLGNSTLVNESMNPLFKYFVEDILSNMSLENKSISVHYFSLTNAFTENSLDCSLSSINSAINGNNQLINALNMVKGSIMSGDNATALYIMNKTIEGVSSNIAHMSFAYPYYYSFNNSLSKFLYDFKRGTLTPQDIESLKENTSAMLTISSGEFKNMLKILYDTLNQWTQSNYIFYDLLYEANSTLPAVQGFLQNYQGAIMLNNSLTGIKMEINYAPVGNTTAHIEYLVGYLKNANAELEKQKEFIENAMGAIDTPYYRWYTQMLSDLDYVLYNSNVAEYAMNIFVSTLQMMNEGSPGGNMGDFTIFYSLKHAFDSNVVPRYKEEIQSMYLTIMGMMKIGKEYEGEMPSMPSSPSIKLPNLNPSYTEKKNILKNMSYEEITKTVSSIENYNASEFMNTVNSTIPIVENASANMSSFANDIEKLVNNMKFVYSTTGDSNVSNMLKMYTQLHANISAASNALDSLSSNLPHMSGFTYMMHRFSGQLKTMFSKDFNGKTAKAAMLIVMLNDTRLLGESDTQHSKRMEALEERVESIAKESDISSKVMVMGTYLISQATEKTSNETMNVIFPIAIILVIVILLITFRSIVDTLLGILGLGMAISWAYGFGVIMNYNFNQISTTVAVLLVGLGIDYAIHTILRYREELRKGRKVRDAMNEMITHLGMGLILATITTIIAFLSNVSSPIPPVSDFGIMNAVGIFGAFVIFTTAIPAMKILIDEHREKKGKLKINKEKEREGSGLIVLNKFMALSAMAAEHHRIAVIAAVLIISGVAIYGGMNVNTTFDLKDFLPQNLEITDTINFMMDHFNASGMSDNYVLIEGNITSPSALKAVQATMENMKDDDYIDYSQSSSITTLISEWKEKNSTFAKMVSGNDTNGDGLPDKNIKAIYDWLYENANGKSILHKSNGTYDSMLIIIRSSASNDKENKILTKEIDVDIQPLKDAGLKAIPTGTNLLTFHILDMLEGSQWRSLMITVIASLIVLTIVFLYEKRSWILGLITSIPVVLALLWLLGSMYALGINFNVVTVTITSLTIGLGITYAIHITHRFLEDWGREKSIEDAVKETVRHTGTSIFGAAATTMAGFGTLMLSSMPPIQQFGEIAALSILYSFVLSVFILPTFLYMWASWREKRNKL